MVGGKTKGCLVALVVLLFVDEHFLSGNFWRKAHGKHEECFNRCVGDWGAFR